MTTAMAMADPVHSAPLPAEDESRLSASLYCLHASALFAFAVFVTCSIAGAHLSLGLLTGCIIAEVVSGQSQRKQKLHELLLGIEWPIIAFVIVALISTAFSEKPFDSFRNLRHLLTILGAYAVAHSLRSHPQWRRPLLWTFIASATGFSIFGFGEFAFGVSRKVQSTQGTTMTWGALCVMFMSVTAQVALAASNRRERWLARLCAAPQVFAMLLSFVRGAYVGFAVSVIYLLRRYWAGRRILLWRIFPVIAILLVVAMFLSPASVRQRAAAIFDLKTGSTQVRLVQWEYALQIVQDHPLLGVGWRDLQPVMRQYARPHPELPMNVIGDVFSIGHFHSAYFTILVCLGVPGLVAFLWLMVAVWRKLEAAARRAGTNDERLMIDAVRAAMLGFLVAGLFDWTFGDAEVVTMFWFVIGLGLGQANQQTEISPESRQRR